MPIASATTFYLHIRGGRVEGIRLGDVFFDAFAAEQRSWELLRDGEGREIDLWQIKHTDQCEVGALACSCSGSSETLLKTLSAENCPCWSGNEHGCLLHGPLAHLGQQRGRRVSKPQPRIRLSALAERAS